MGGGVTVATESEKAAALYAVKRLNSLGLRFDADPEKTAEELIQAIENQPTKSE